MKAIKEFQTCHEVVIFLENQNTIIFATEEDYKTYTYLSYTDAEKMFFKLKRALCESEKIIS